VPGRYHVKTGRLKGCLNRAQIFRMPFKQPVRQECHQVVSLQHSDQNNETGD
jgi:hypothetical protein